MDHDAPPGSPSGRPADAAGGPRRSDGSPAARASAGAYVVEVPFRIPEERLGPIVASVAGELGVPPERIRRVLAGRAGPVTRPLAREQAERVGRALRRAGVPAVVAPAEVRGAFAARAAAQEGASAPPASAVPRETPLSHRTLAGVAPGPRAERGSIGHAHEEHGSEEHEDGEHGAGEHGGEEHAGDGWSFGDAGVARRRWWLAGSLLAALVALVALQVLWASPAVGGAAAGGAAEYDRGLAALRRGDFGTARAAWEAAADEDPRAAYLRGALAERGWGQPWSNAEASRWYRRAAQRGHPAAARRLARLYETGMGVEPSFEAARSWYERAARAGDELAAVRLADLLLAGAGGPVDAGGARAWLERAAAAGSFEAQGRLRLLEPAPGQAGAPRP